MRYIYQPIRGNKTQNYYPNALVYQSHLYCECLCRDCSRLTSIEALQFILYIGRGLLTRIEALQFILYIVRGLLTSIEALQFILYIVRGLLTSIEALQFILYIVRGLLERHMFLNLFKKVTEVELENVLQQVNKWQNQTSELLTTLYQLNQCA